MSMGKTLKIISKIQQAINLQLTLFLLLYFFCNSVSYAKLNDTFFFQRSNGDILDPNGNRFIIKATNVSCWLYQENYIFGGAQNVHEVAMNNLNDILGPHSYDHFSIKMMENFITADDIRLMKKMGFNSVRVGFSAESFNSGKMKSKLFSSLDNLIPVFKEHELPIILTMMRAPSPQNKLWTSNYTKGSLLLWDSEEAKKKTVDIWSEIADHFKNEQIILRYDIINEPNISRKREKELIDLYQKITHSIRDHDTNHMIIYEGNGYATKLNIFSEYDDLLDDNACYQFHFYSWFGSKIETTFPKHMEIALSNNRPIFCGEFGINRYSKIKHEVNFMDYTFEMDGWAMYTWKAIELSTEKSEKKRPPYYGKWIFISFEDLHMSILQFQMGDEMRDLMDWITSVKGSDKPSKETTSNVLDRIVKTVEVQNCSINKKHLEALSLNLN